MKIKIKCPKCNYEWETKSKLKMVTCPCCQLKVRVEEKKKSIHSVDDPSITP